MSANNRTVQSVDRALIILKHIAGQAHRPVTLGELTERIGIDRSAAYRLVTTLVDHNLVHQDSGKRGYSLGAEILKLAGAMERQLDIRELARPLLRTLNEQSGEDTHLCIPGDDHGVIIDKLPSREALSVNTMVGGMVQLHNSAIGKALLCSHDEEEVRVLFRGRRLEKTASCTITRIKDLVSELERIRMKRLAIDDEEYKDGLKCLAAPIFNHHGKVAFSIGISGPKERVEKNIRSLEASIVDAGIQLSKKLGFVEEEARS